MSVDPLRHYPIFKPDAFGQRQVAVIGAGAIGSKIVLELCKLGVQNIVVYDYDTVAEHNIANQAFAPEHIGMLKVDALKLICKQFADTDIVTHSTEVTSATKISPDVCFLAVDSMAARRDIIKTVLFGNFKTSICIETRMDAKICTVYTIKPTSPQDIAGYMQYFWYPDEEVVVESACGSTITVGATANLAASLAVWQFIKTANGEPYHNEIMMCVEPPLVNVRDLSELRIAAVSSAVAAG